MPWRAKLNADPLPWLLEPDNPLQMYLSDVCTIPVNIAGLPAISVPCGFVDSLPVGLHIMGKPFDESTILRVAYAYEQATDWHKTRPPL